MIVRIGLRSFDDVRTARERVRDLASAAGLPDPEAAMLVTAELGNNCVEHRSTAFGTLRICCHPGRLSLRFENRCRRRPTWRTRKPFALPAVRTGGNGLRIARSIARRVICRWMHGRVTVLAELIGSQSPRVRPATPTAAGRGRRRWAQLRLAPRRSTALCGASSSGSCGSSA